MTVKKPTPSERQQLVDAAMGRVPVDLLIENVRLVNVFSGEIYPADIGIVAGFIAFAAAAAAADAGMRLAMNPAPIGPEVKSYPLDRLTWLVVNEIEGRELADIDLGNNGGDEADDDVVAELRRLYPGAIVVMTLGKKGAIRADREGTFRSSFPDQGPIVDTTGAGDTFIGYFLAGEVSGMEREAGLRRACAAGAIAVTRAGATTGKPSLSEVEAIL